LVKSDAGYIWKGLKVVLYIRQRWAIKLFIKVPANFLGMSARKSANFVSNPQIAKLQISTKYCTTLSQNSPKSRRLHNFFLLCTHFIWSFICYIWKGKLFICGLAEALSPQIKKNWVCKMQIRKGSHLLKVRKSNKYLSPKICGFAFCRTHLRIAQL
jgi:hypothetical protein